MGRTKRKRLKRKFNYTMNELSLDNNSDLINLRKWMKQTFHWKNKTLLNVRDFLNTGRGLYSIKNLLQNDVIITLPFEIMISLNTINNSELVHFIISKIKMTDALVLFLSLEKHKNEHSYWYNFIKTMPNEEPLLPWLCTHQELVFIPDEFRLEIQEKIQAFDLSWENVKKSINMSWKCLCCGEYIDCVLTKNLYRWAFIMVATRCVYVNPDLCLNSLDKALEISLSDKPSVALCPFLDLFNHSYDANMSAELTIDGNQLNYQLKTYKAYKKYDQIFILYGSHDNFKLLLEYGFFIPYNIHDKLSFSLDDIIKYLQRKRYNLNSKQYRFLKEKNLNRDLYVSSSGLSFNLKAVFYVALNENETKWSNTIYNSSYTKTDLKEMFVFSRDLLMEKESNDIRLYDLLDNVKICCRYLENLKLFYTYRRGFIKELLLYLNRETIDM